MRMGQMRQNQPTKRKKTCISLTKCSMLMTVRRNTIFSYLRYIYKIRVNRVIATFPFSRVISSVKRVLVTQLELARAKIS